MRTLSDDTRLVLSWPRSRMAPERCSWAEWKRDNDPADHDRVAASLAATGVHDEPGTGADWRLVIDEGKE